MSCTARRLRLPLVLTAIAVVFAVGCEEPFIEPKPTAPNAPNSEPDTTPSFSGAVDDRTYTVGEAIQHLQLPTAIEGDGDLTYGLTPTVPGLTFDAGVSVLSGTPSTAGTYEMTYTVEDEDADYAELTFTIMVEEPVPPNQAPVVSAELRALDLQFPTGRVAVRYQLTDYFDDSDGDPLAFAASSSNVAVAIAAVARDMLTVDTVGPGQAIITVRATDPDGASATQHSSISVVETEPADITNTYRGRGDEVFHLNPDGAPLVDAGYRLELGTSAAAEVYLIATNTNEYRSRSRFKRLDAGRGAEIRGAVDDSRLWQRSGPRAWRPEVSEFNNNPPLGRAVAFRGDSYSRQSRSQAGDRHTFLDLDAARNVVSVPATARRVVGDGTRTLTVWVEDASWGTGCRLSACVQQPMVDAIAERFLRSGAGNDIYDWTVAVFGDPWGPHEYDDFLIPPEAASELHILVFDIDGEEGSIGGFFWGKDALIRDPASEDSRKASNERLIFYIDAFKLADSPARMMTTLAHEFQHMIHFYQKPVLSDGISEAWLNEMASEVAADLIADKLSVHGPRGVLDDPSAGDPENRRGWLPRYNFFNWIRVTAWDSEDVSKHYSISYALGAYLARTYGAALFSDIVQSDRSGVDAIEEALRRQGHAVSFGDVLMNWAAANLLSDNTTAPVPYRYNSRDWSTSHSGGQTYRLGSVNLYNYRYYYDEGPDDYLDGPRLYPFSQFRDGLWKEPHSNAYTTLGRITGTVSLRIDADAGNRITAVVKQ